MQSWLEWVRCNFPFSLDASLVSVNLLTIWFVVPALIHPRTPRIGKGARVVLLLSILSLLSNVYWWIEAPN